VPHLNYQRELRGYQSLYIVAENDVVATALAETFLARPAYRSGRDPRKAFCVVSALKSEPAKPSGAYVLHHWA
jgi:hypothetical protein